jgi:hypothetical protein
MYFLTKNNFPKNSQILAKNRKKKVFFGQKLKFGKYTENNQKTMKK